MKFTTCNQSETLFTNRLVNFIVNLWTSQQTSESNFHFNEQLVEINCKINPEIDVRWTLVAHPCNELYKTFADKNWGWSSFWEGMAWSWESLGRSQRWIFWWSHAQVISSDRQLGIRHNKKSEIRPWWWNYEYWWRLHWKGLSVFAENINNSVVKFWGPPSQCHQPSYVNYAIYTPLSTGLHQENQQVYYAKIIIIFKKKFLNPDI